MDEQAGNLRRHYITLIPILTSAFATLLSISMVPVATPYIKEALQLGYADLTWIQNAYKISYAILLPVFGQLGDRYGQRKVLLYGLALFGIGSILSGMSWSLLSMILFRFIQGIGAAAMFPNALVLAIHSAPRQHRGKVMGVWAMAVSLGQVAGPTLGGVLIQLFQWRAVFLVNVLFVASSFLCIARLVPPEPAESREAVAFDYTGTMLLAVIVTALVMAMTSGPDVGWTQAGVLLLLAVAVGSMPIFYRVERGHDNPVVQPALFRNRTFLAGVFTGAIHLIAIQGTMFLMPLFLAQVHQLNALRIGLLMLPQAAIRLVASPLAGHLSDRYGNSFPVTIGLVVRGVAMISLALLTPHSSLMVIAATMVLDGAGAALIWAPSLSASIQSCSDDMAGSAAGVFNMMRLVIGLIGIVVIGVIMDHSFVGVPEAGAVSGFMHSYLILAALMVIGLMGVKYLEPRSSAMTPLEGQGSAGG